MSQLAIDPATVQASLRKTSLLVDLGFGASVRQFEDTYARVDRRGLFYVILYHKKVAAPGVRRQRRLHHSIGG